jgi:LDH2 family malate/lactate/ureidoglycolate dehydrogenase
MREYYVATRMGDSDGASEAMDKIMKFNERYSDYPITPKTLKHSMAQHMRTTQEMYHGITVSKPMRDRIMRMAEEYEDYEQ